MFPEMKEPTGVEKTTGGARCKGGVEAHRFASHGSGYDSSGNAGSKCFVGWCPE
jgi:hypothetical protein